VYPQQNQYQPVQQQMQTPHLQPVDPMFSHADPQHTALADLTNHQIPQPVASSQNEGVIHQTGNSRSQDDETVIQIR
jgi:hypothetical protein